MSHRARCGPVDCLVFSRRPARNEAWLSARRGRRRWALAVVARARPHPGQNVNMISGPRQISLQRQNDPRWPCRAEIRSTCSPAPTTMHRRLPGLPAEKETGDAWLGVYKSSNGGHTWTTPFARVPQDQSPAGLASPLKGFQAAADATARPAPTGSSSSTASSSTAATTSRGDLRSRWIDNPARKWRCDPVLVNTLVVPTPDGSRQAVAAAVDVPLAGAPMCHRDAATVLPRRKNTSPMPSFPERTTTRSSSPARPAAGEL
jgi:hypothetical protein